MPDVRAARYLVVLAPVPVDEHGSPVDADDPLVLFALHGRVDVLDGPALDRAVAAAGAAGLHTDADGRALLHRAVDVVIPWNRLVNTLTLDGRDFLVTGETVFEMQEVEEPGLLAALAASGITGEPLAGSRGGGEPAGTEEDLRPLAAWLAGLLAHDMTSLTADLIEVLAELERFGPDSDMPLSSLRPFGESGAG